MLTEQKEASEIRKISREATKRSNFVREWAKNYYDSWISGEQAPKEFRRVAASAVDAAEAIYDELNERHPEIEDRTAEK